MNNVELKKEQTMSSREIAELMGKRHPDVKRDIESMSESLEIDVSKFAHIYKDRMNRNQTEYHLNRYHTEILITGYDVKRRAAVIKRWFELEDSASKSQELPEWRQPREPLPASSKEEQDYANHRIREDLKLYAEIYAMCNGRHADAMSARAHELLYFFRPDLKSILRPDSERRPTVQS